MTKKFLLISSISCGLLFIGFLVIAIVLAANGYAPLGVDNAVADWAYSIRGEKGGATYWFFRIITEFGYTYFVIFIILLMGVIWKFRSKTWFFAGTILVSWCLQQLVKALANRPRPDETLWWMTETSSSFPSGHSITVACVFVLLAYFIITSPTVKKWVKYLIGVLSDSAIVLVPLSRLILGVHYFTDVLAGVFFGAFIALLGIIAYNTFLHFNDKRKAKLVASADADTINNKEAQQIDSERINNTNTSTVNNKVINNGENMSLANNKTKNANLNNKKKIKVRMAINIEEQQDEKTVNQTLTNEQKKTKWK